MRKTFILLPLCLLVLGCSSCKIQNQSASIPSKPVLTSSQDGGESSSHFLPPASADSDTTSSSATSSGPVSLDEYYSYFMNYMNVVPDLAKVPSNSNTFYETDLNGSGGSFVDDLVSRYLVVNPGCSAVILSEMGSMLIDNGFEKTDAQPYTLNRYVKPPKDPTAVVYRKLVQRSGSHYYVSLQVVNSVPNEDGTKNSDKTLIERIRLM